MKFKKYYISNNLGKSNCVIRTFCKVYNKNYDEVYNELLDISSSLNCESYNETKVFETYMKRNNTNSIRYGKGTKIKDLELNDGTYIIFCWDRHDYYHMVTIIDNVLYDKDNKSFELYTINIYEKR